MSDSKMCEAGMPAREASVKYKINATLKDGLYNEEIERYLYTNMNGDVMAIKVPEIEYIETSQWNAERALRVENDKNPFKKVIVETL